MKTSTLVGAATAAVLSAIVAGGCSQSQDEAESGGGDPAGREEP